VLRPSAHHVIRHDALSSFLHLLRHTCY
jgi:hypothetical protein